MCWSERPGAKKVVVGRDFRFGKKRSGDVALLQELAPKYGYELIVIEKLQMDHQDVSSTRIRAYTVERCVCGARRSCARESAGKDDSEFRQPISVPIRISCCLRTAYTFPAFISGGEEGSYYGITNVGVKPTVEEHAAKDVETNIVDFHRDIYGSIIKVELLHISAPGNAVFLAGGIAGTDGKRCERRCSICSKKTDKNLSKLVKLWYTILKSSTAFPE